MKWFKRKTTKILIFTYGTLMRGNHNNYVLGKARFVCEAKIKNHTCYGLPYGFPMVIKDKNDYSNNKEVIGEIWEVEITQVPRLDSLEGYREWSDDGMYLRRETKAYDCRNNKSYEVSYYLWNSDIPKDSVLVPSGQKWRKSNIYK